MFLEKAILKKQELDALRPFEKNIEERVMQKLRIDWNYHSNSIEGNSLTYGETKSLLLHHITAQGKPLRDHFEITGHNEAINLVLDVIKGDRNITENFIRELHKLILKENYTKNAVTLDGQETTKEIKVGEYKTQPNHVKTKSGEIFYFAEPFEVNAKMSDLIEWYTTETQRKDFNPILLATEFHYKFVRIHPFDDGNGRLSRILMNFILVKFGYHPAVIKNENKEKYYEVLRIADGDDINPFIEFISECVFDSLNLMHKAILGIKFEEEDDVDKQFWLLNERLKGLNKLNKKKSIDSTKEILSQVFVPLVEKLSFESSRFKELYFETEINFLAHLGKSGGGNVKINVQKLFEKSILTNLDEVRFSHFFKLFKTVVHLNFEYSNMVEISFSDLFYTLFVMNGRGAIYTAQKSYGEIFSEDELKTIVTITVQEHIKRIDEYISIK